MGDNATIDRGATAVDGVLAHYGVPGMKWGVRKASSSVSSVVSKKKSGSSHEVSEDHAKAVAALSKPASALSNTEMQTIITRMNLEKQYTQALKTAPPPPTRGQKVGRFVTSLLVDVGRTEVKRLARTAGAVQVERAVLGPKATTTTFRTDVANKLRPPPGGKKKKGSN